MPKPESISDTCPQLPSRAVAGVTSGSYSIRIITPLFGGGAVAGIHDERFPVRPSAIRGHLRHWWRLIIGRELGAGMRQREEEIFGSTEFPSPVGIRVTSWSSVETVDPTYGNRFGPIAYALFPAIENEQQVVREGVTFTLELTWLDKRALCKRRDAQNQQREKRRQKLLPRDIDPIEPDLEAAFEAWIQFGGLGARTRRGCGAVHAPTTGTALTRFPGRIFVGKPTSEPLEAWKLAVEVYQTFRQSPRGRRHGKTIRTRGGPITIKVPGRSHWPEADSIRHLTGCALRPGPGAPVSGAPVPADEDPHDHSKPVVPSSVLPSFPKAVLGLPINFHFSDGPRKDRPGERDLDPQGTQLYPLIRDQEGRFVKAERMASPVITRPLSIDGKWYPAVILLQSSLPADIGVRLEGNRARAGGGDLVADMKIKHVVDPSLKCIGPMRGHASALDALADFLAYKDYGEHRP